MLSVLVLGGYGFFGARIVKALAADERLRLLVGGRDAYKAAGIGRDGEALSLTWHLLAAQNHGPQIRCGAAVALVRKLAGGEVLSFGAMPCVGLLSVEEYLAPLADLDIREVMP
jgi:nucleoside-diphosphate-sugar epimerase